ncbi:CUB domain-containing protein [Ditylenchus destructor]|nr:CUB domain-containing protein [Ditylenchus destructor]
MEEAALEIGKTQTATEALKWHIILLKSAWKAPYPRQDDDLRKNLASNSAYFPSKLPPDVFASNLCQYPRSYPPNQRCTVELSTPKASGFVIHVFFIDLDLEERFSKSKQCLRDYIIFTIYDREGRQHIGERICGSATGGELPEPIKAMQTRIRITFVSSSGQSSTRRGFKVRYEFVAEAVISAPPSLYFDSNTRFRRECGGQNDVYGLSGTVTSPGYPYTFPGNVIIGLTTMLYSIVAFGTLSNRS